MSSAPAANKPEAEGRSFLRPYGDSQLDRLRDRVDYLQDRVGSDAALQRHVEAVLTQTLRQCSAGRPEEMAAILAPAIMTALRDEIRYSPDTVAQAMRPLAGRLLWGSVASFAENTLWSVGSSIRLILSPWRWFGRQDTEPQVAHSHSPLVVRDVLVIHRATSLLVSREPISVDQGRNIDEAFVNEATSAIVSFVRSAYAPNEPGGPSVLSFGDRQWMIRADADAILAFSYAGRGQTGLGQRFDQVGLWLERTWGGELRQFAGPLPVDRERALNRDLRAQMAGIGDTEEAPSGPSWHHRVSRWAVVGCIIAAAAGFTVWQVEAFQARSIEKLAVSVVEGHPDLLGYPVTVEFDGATEHVVLQGLMPNKFVADNVVESLSRATGFPVVRMFGILSTDRLGTDERPVAEVMAELGSDVRSLGQELSLLAGSVADSERADSDWRRAQSERLGRLAAQVAPAMSSDDAGLGSELARWGEVNRFLVNLDSGTVDPASLNSVSDVGTELAEGQFIGLFTVDVGPEADVQRATQAIGLVREQLIRLGFDGLAIVDRLPNVRRQPESAGGQAPVNSISIGLEVIDVSRL